MGNVLGGDTRTSYLSILPAIPAIVAFAVLSIVAHVRKAHLWLVPGWLAAAALAPVFSTFFAIRILIAVFRGFATGGGGIAAASAGLWEATQPLLMSLYVSSVLAAATFVLSIRSVATGEEEETSGSDRKSQVLSLSVILLAAIGALSTVGLFRNVTGIIITVIDPHATQSLAIAEISSLIASRILLTSGTAILMTVGLLAATVVVAIVDPQRPPGAVLAKFFVFVALMAMLASAGTALAVRSSAKRLYNAAVTGQFAP